MLLVTTLTVIELIQAYSKNSDQRLVWAFVGHTYHIVENLMLSLIYLQLFNNTYSHVTDQRVGNTIFEHHRQFFHVTITAGCIWKKIFIGPVTGKGVYMYKGVGVRFADFISFIPWKWNNLVSLGKKLQMNHWRLIWYLFQK